MRDIARTKPSRVASLARLGEILLKIAIFTNFMLLWKLYRSKKKKFYLVFLAFWVVLKGLR